MSSYSYEIDPDTNEIVKKVRNIVIDEGGQIDHAIFESELNTFFDREEYKKAFPNLFD